MNTVILSHNHILVLLVIIIFSFIGFGFFIFNAVTNTMKYNHKQLKDIHNSIFDNHMELKDQILQNELMMDEKDYKIKEELKNKIELRYKDSCNFASSISKENKERFDPLEKFVLDFFAGAKNDIHKLYENYDKLNENHESFDQLINYLDNKIDHVIDTIEKYKKDVIINDINCQKHKFGSDATPVLTNVGTSEIVKKFNEEVKSTIDNTMITIPNEIIYSNSSIDILAKTNGADGGSGGRSKQVANGCSGGHGGAFYITNQRLSCGTGSKLCKAVLSKT